MKDKNEKYDRVKQQFAEMVKNRQPATPIQEVRPVVAAQPKQEPKNEVHVNFWIDADLMDRVKLCAVKQRKTIKQIGRDALEEYLRTQNA